MQGRPTDAELFSAIYEIVTAQGREAALFGDARQGASEFFDRSLVLGTFPVLYFEFPLLGEPYLDMLAIYEHVPANPRFAPGGGYGYQEVFDWYGGLDAARRAAIGIELDLSQGVTEQGGLYFQQRGELALLREFLATVGQGQRSDAYTRMQQRMPRGWKAAYVGLFPAREGTPMRLGGYLSEPMRRLCSEDPSFMASRFEEMGFLAYDRPMLERCASLMGLTPGIDFQFDLDPDGNLLDTFGLSLSFGRCKLSEVDECFSRGYGAQVMGMLQGWGLADRRWELIPKMTFARGITFERLDGSRGRLVMCVRLNYAKVKFVGSQMQAAKFYLAATVEELPA